jgi:hypothetical protein
MPGRSSKPRDKEDRERLIKTTVYLEEDIFEALRTMATELTSDTGRKWSTGAVIRLALSEFFARRGKII